MPSTLFHYVSLRSPSFPFLSRSTFHYDCSLQARIFSTFYSNTTALPTEITTQILSYIVTNAEPLPLGGSVRTYSTHYPITLVSQTLRLIYLDQPYSPSPKGRATAPVKLKISETLEFSDLRSLAAFFEDSPGRNAATLHNIRSLSISYVDDHTATGRGRWTTNYAYEAFEYLYRN